jgi:simple sugar transport system permease protein
VCAVARLYLRANEVITTLLMNYVAYNLTQQLLYGPWRNPADGYPVSESLAPGERLALLGFGHVHAGLFIALGMAVFCWWLTGYSRAGILARAVAANPAAAKAVGVKVNRLIILMTCLAGALSGLAGFCVVAGEEYKLTQFVGNDFIFPSIVVAYLARANPLGVVAASLCIAGLYSAGDSLKAFYQLPGATVLTIEAALLLCVSAFEFFLSYQLTWVKPK